MRGKACGCWVWSPAGPCLALFCGTAATSGVRMSASRTAVAPPIGRRVNMHAPVLLADHQSLVWGSTRAGDVSAFFLSVEALAS